MFSDVAKVGRFFDEMGMKCNIGRYKCIKNGGTLHLFPGSVR